MGTPPGDKADDEDREGRGGDQPAADVSPLKNYIRMTNKKGSSPKYVGPKLGEGMSGGGRTDKGGEGVDE